MKHQKIYVNNEVFKGFFDTDGSIGCYIRERPLGLARSARKSKSGNKFLGFYINYSLDQAAHNKSSLYAFAEHLGGTVVAKQRLTGRNAGKVEYTLSADASSPLGERFREILSSNPPLVPEKFAEFLASEKIREIQTSQSKKPKELTYVMLQLALLINKKADNLENVQRKLNIIGASEEQLERGKEIANECITEINQKVEEHRKSLETKTLTNDYIIGAHYGDGGVTFLYEMIKTDPPHYNIRPNFTVSIPDRVVLECFTRTLGGYIHRAGKKDGVQYVFSGIKEFEKTIIPIFKDINLPEYKQNQWNRALKAFEILKNKEHLTDVGWTQFVELTYDMSINHKRNKSKEEIIAQNIAYFRSKAKN